MLTVLAILVLIIIAGLVGINAFDIHSFNIYEAIATCLLVGSIIVSLVFAGIWAIRYLC